MTTVWQRPEWHDNAACRDTSPTIFFPRTAGIGNVLKALKICESCPVIKECGEWAATQNEEFGIWGGQSCRQRTRARRKLIPKSALCVICECEYAPKRLGSKTCSRRCADKNRYRLQAERRAAQRGAA